MVNQKFRHEKIEQFRRKYKLDFISFFIVGGMA
jgi:hypothetical protein